MEPRTTPSYVAHVDGLRAVAVVAVMAYHLDADLLPGGFVGVDVFFVISGFVVTASLAGHKHETIGSFLARFYARRLARLIPALVTMLVATTLLYVLFVPKAWFNQAAETVGQWAFWGLSNWNLDRQVVNYFEPRAELNPFTHTWSLGVEEQFYLVVPVLLFVALGTRVRRRQTHAMVALIAILALVSLLLCFYVGVARGPRHVFYLLGYRFWELAAGVLLYLVGRQVTRVPVALESLHRLSAPIGIAAIALAMAWPHPQAYPYLRSAVAVVGTMLAIGLPGVARSGRIPAALSHPAALWIGHRSYALYLWHWPVYVLARWTTGLTQWPFNLLAVALSVGLAAASFRLIENPIRYSRTLSGWAPSARISLLLGIVAVGWGLGAWMQANQPALGLTDTARRPADWYPAGGLLANELGARRQCEPVARRSALGHHQQAVTEFDVSHCGAASVAQPSLYAVGDSHVVAYLPMLEQLAAEQVRAVTAINVPGCPYIDMLAPMSKERNPACHDAAREAQAELVRRARPGDIVLLSSLRLPRLIELGGKQRKIAADGTYELSEDERRSVAAASDDAIQWLRPLAEAGLRIVLELPKPIFRAHPFQCVDWFNRANPDCAAGLTEGRSAQERYRAPVVAALRELSRTVPAVQLWDPVAQLCDDLRCSALRSGRPLYFDGDHLSPYGNLVLSPDFSALVADLSRATSVTALERQHAPLSTGARNAANGT